MPEQYPSHKMRKITRSEMMSLGCLQDGVPTRKLQDLGIANNIICLANLTQ